MIKIFLYIIKEILPDSAPAAGSGTPDLERAAVGAGREEQPRASARRRRIRGPRAADRHRGLRANVVKSSSHATSARLLCGCILLQT